MANQLDAFRPAGDLTGTPVDPAGPGGELIDAGGGETVASTALDNVWKGDGGGGWTQGPVPPSGPLAHDLAGAEHNADTLADLNAKISDATLDDSAAARTPTAHTHGAADVNSGAFVDARIAETNVTQHEAAISHDALADFLVTEHRVINDAGTSTTETWSASKIDSEISTLSSGFDLKAGVDTSTETLGNITLSGEQTLNGLLTSASRVLVVEQTLPEENGIYVTAAGAWSRAPDADGSPSNEVSNGNITHVLNSGSTKFRNKYLLVTADPITVGTTGQTWEEHKNIDFGTTTGTATEGDDSRVPTQDENDAQVGTDGAPSTANKYVTNSDPRNADARTPVQATEIAVGGGELATQVETDAGTDDTRIVTPLKLTNFSGFILPPGVGAVLVSVTTRTEFATITLALASAIAGDVVYVGPGTYAESFTIPTNVSVISLGGPERTSITGSLATGARVTMSNGARLQGVAVTLPTDATAAIASAITGLADIVDCNLVGAGASGIGIQQTGSGRLVCRGIDYDSGVCAAAFSVTAGILTVQRGMINGGTLTDAFSVSGGTLNVMGYMVMAAATVTDVLEVGAGMASVTGTTWQTGTNGVHLTNNAGSAFLTEVVVEAAVVTHVLVDGGVSTAELDIHGGDWIFNRFSAPAAWLSGDNLQGHFEDETTGDVAFVVLNELHVGHAEEGHEFAQGEGDSYTRGMVVITTDGTAGAAADGGNLTDVSADAASFSGSTFTFQGVTAGHAIMFGSSLGNAGGVLKHWGLKLLQTTAAVEVTPKSFVFEIWDGAAWVAIGVMTTHANLYHRYANELFIRSNTIEHVRYGIIPSTTWATKLISGDTLFWSRIRIATTVTTAPAFEQSRLHPSRFEGNPDGTNSYHGNARFRTTLFGMGNIFGESGTVVDATPAVGSGGLPTGWPHAVKNSLLNSSADAIYLQFVLPRGIDTSHPVIPRLVYSVEASGGGPTDDADLILSALPVEVSGVLVADPSGGTTPTSRTVANTAALTANAGAADSSSGLNIPTTADAKLHQLVFAGIDVSDYYEGDVVLLRLELDDDGTDNIDVLVWALEVSAVRWTHGEKL